MNTSFENISAIYRDWLHSLGSQNFKGFHHKSQRLWTCCHHHRGAWWMTSILPERSQEVPNRIDRRAGVSSKVKSALWWWSDSRRWHYRVQKSWSQGKKWSPDQRIQIIVMSPNLCTYLLTNYLPPAEADDVLYGHHCFLSPLKDPIRSNPSNPFNPIHPIHPIQSNPIQSCFSARTFQHLWRGLLTGQLWLSLSEFVLCADHNWFLHCFPRSAELLKFTSSVSENK